jgi:hypothetical protein
MTSQTNTLSTSIVTSSPLTENASRLAESSTISTTLQTDDIEEPELLKSLP